MNQLCKVCGEPAAGFHFGAFTCEGCKSFFGRTYNNLSSLSECKNSGRCVINKKNRTSCKSCRLRKCLMVGMSKSGSRYGRRSNWFKIHCLLQDQAALNGFPPMSGGPKLGYEADECGGMTPGGRDSPPNHGHSKMSDGEMNGGESPDSRDDSASPPTPIPSHHHHHMNHGRSTNMLIGPGTMLGRGGPCGGGLPSPFSPAYDSPSPPSSASSASDQGTKREFLPPPPQLPISPISPLSPMHQPKFLFGPTGYLNGPAGSLYPKYLGAYRPYLPFLGAGGHGGLSGPFDHLFASSKSTPPSRVVTLLAPPPELQDGTPPEQEDPIDLSVKKSPPGPRGILPSRSPSPNSMDDEDSMRGASGCGSEGHSAPGSPIRPDSPLDLTTSTPIPAVSSPCPRA